MSLHPDRLEGMLLNDRLRGPFDHMRSDTDLIVLLDMAARERDPITIAYILGRLDEREGRALSENAQGLQRAAEELLGLRPPPPPRSSRPHHHRDLRPS